MKEDFAVIISVKLRLPTTKIDELAGFRCPVLILGGMIGESPECVVEVDFPWAFSPCTVTA
jgi:hypothetical protein